MRNPIAVPSLALLALILTVLTPSPVHACSCFAPGAATAELAKADAVFVGRAVSVVTEQREVAEIRSFFSQLRVTFELERVWKGLPEGESVVVTTAGDGAACGYGFEQGETYLVYAYAPPPALGSESAEPQDRPLTTNLCTRNAPLERAGEDLTALGAPARVVTGR